MLVKQVIAKPVHRNERRSGAAADFMICPDNTIHQAFDMVVERSPLPWLHIAEEVAAEADRRGYEQLGVMGTILARSALRKAMGRVD